MGVNKLDYYLGFILIISILPFSFMLYQGFINHNSPLYLLQLSLIVLFIILEFILDYYLKIDFRSNKPILITYVTLFFASTGGLIGIAGYAGKSFTITTVILFIIMTFLSFYQRFKTGY